MTLLTVGLAISALAGTGILLLVLFVFCRVAHLAWQKKSLSEETLVGEIGEAQTPLNPAGIVLVRCSSYCAAANASIAAGVRVRVTKAATILTVEPYSR